MLQTTTTINSLRQAILSGKPLTPEQKLAWLNRFNEPDEPLTGNDLARYVAANEKQFNAILATHDADIISNWQTISSTAWHSIGNSNTVLQCSRGQVYVLCTGEDDETAVKDDDASLDWL